MWSPDILYVAEEEDGKGEEGERKEKEDEDDEDEDEDEDPDVLLVLADESRASLRPVVRPGGTVWTRDGKK